MGSGRSEDGEWEWILSPRAEDQFEQLEKQSQERIASKLDDVVSAEWRDPEDFLDPVANSPFRKLRVGGYRLGCRLVSDTSTLRVESIRKREGAYKADDYSHLPNVRPAVSTAVDSVASYGLLRLFSARREILAFRERRQSHYVSRSVQSHSSPYK